MAQTGNFTPILLYGSSTPGNVPLAANLTNSTDGSEIAINIADKNLFFKDSGGTVNTVPIRQSGTSSNGWLSSTDWNTFNNKQPAGTYVTAISIASSNGFTGTSSGGATPSLTLATSVTGILKGNGTAISAATSGTDYAPATSGTSILYGNGAGGFSNVTIGTGVSFAGGTLSATGSGGTVTSVAALTIGTTGTDLSSTVANGTTTPVITLNVPTASATNRGALSSTDWSTFNNKQATLISGSNIKTVAGVSLLGSGDVGTIGVGYGGTGLTSLTANYIPYGNGTGAFSSSSSLTYNGTTLSASKITSTSGPSNPGAGSSDFGIIATGAYGGGLLLVDGTYNWGIWDNSSTLTIGSGTSLGALTSRLTLTTGGALNVTSIQFGSGAVMSNYETGTWTPVPSGSGGSITSYTSSGTYTRIGRQVFYTGRFTITNPGTVNGSLTISGLPFTAGASTTGVTREDANTGNWYFLQVTAGGSGQAQGWSIINGAILWTTNSSYAFSFTTYI